MKTRLLGTIAGPCLLALAAAPAVWAQGVAEGPDDVTAVRKDDAAMRAAIAQARRTLPQFLAALAKAPAGAEGFTFKYPLGGWEHIWVDHVARRGDTLTGRLANDPMQDDFELGQPVVVPLKDVDAPIYRWSGRMK